MKRLANHIALEIASGKFDRELGPSARQCVLQSSGEPSIYRWSWICGCCFDFVDDVNASSHWQHCVIHTECGSDRRSGERGG